MNSCRRIKGNVYFKQAPYERFSFELSGRRRIDVNSMGYSPVSKTAIALVVDKKISSIIKTRLQECSLDHSSCDKDSLLVIALKENKNIEIIDEDDSVLYIRLTGMRNYGTADYLLKFGIRLDSVNITFSKCINSYGNSVLAVPLTKSLAHIDQQLASEVLCVAIGKRIPVKLVIDAIEFAVMTTFRVEFNHVTQCACD